MFEFLSQLDSAALDTKILITELQWGKKVFGTQELSKSFHLKKDEM